MECPECNSRLPKDERAGCRSCGWKPAGGRTPEPITDCTGCGSGLDGRGYCRAGGGFSGHRRYQPVACPTCRRLEVSWNGACYACRSFPGDVYGWEKGHYVLEQKGPGRRATEEEAKAFVMQIGMRLEGAEAEGKLRPSGDCLPVGALLLQGATGVVPKERPMARGEA